MQIKNVTSWSSIDVPEGKRPIRIFKAAPLDVRLEEMQMKLRERCELEASEEHDFMPIIEKYVIHPNYQPEVPAQDVAIVCYGMDVDGKKQLCLETVVTNLGASCEVHCRIAIGSKEKISNLLHDHGLFLDIKNDVLIICNELRDLKSATEGE